MIENLYSKITNLAE